MAQSPAPDDLITFTLTLTRADLTRWRSVARSDNNNDGARISEDELAGMFASHLKHWWAPTTNEPDIAVRWLHRADFTPITESDNGLHTRDSGHGTPKVMGEMATKLMEASMALLQATAEQQMNIVVLNKALFYLDLAALRDFGNTVTGERYFALPMGPVVNKYDKRIVRDLKRAGWAEQIEEGMAKPVRAIETIEFDVLGKAEVRLAAKIAKFASTFSSSSISDYAHENPGWIAAYSRAAQGRPAPEIDMHLAMQQVLDADPWLDEALDSKTKRIVENVRTKTLHDW